MKITKKQIKAVNIAVEEMMEILSQDCQTEVEDFGVNVTLPDPEESVIEILKAAGVDIESLDESRSVQEIIDEVGLSLNIENEPELYIEDEEVTCDGGKYLYIRYIMKHRPSDTFHSFTEKRGNDQHEETLDFSYDGRVEKTIETFIKTFWK